MEFEDEKQWNSNAVNNHLVTGIKNMYDTLKESKLFAIQNIKLNAKNSITS